MHCRVRVLLVDDEPQVRRCVGSVLRRHGYEVFEAEHGFAAVESLRREDGKFQIIVTDVVMPRMDGVEFAKAVRQEYPAIPILFMTGFSGREPIQGLPEDHTVAKPFAPATLVAKVRKLVTGGS